MIEQPQGFFRLTLCSPYRAPCAVRENSIRKCRSLIAKVEEAKKFCRKNQKCSSILVQQKARGARIFSLPRVGLTRRTPCIYRTAAFENRTIGKTLAKKSHTPRATVAWSLHYAPACIKMRCGHLFICCDVQALQSRDLLENAAPSLLTTRMRPGFII